jgi:hypothetical protein
LIPLFSSALFLTLLTILLCSSLDPIASARFPNAFLSAASFFSLVAIESPWATRRTLLAAEEDEAVETVGLLTGTKRKYCFVFSRVVFVAPEPEAHAYMTAALLPELP